MLTFAKVHAQYTDDAREALASLDADPTSARLASLVDVALDKLEADPSHREVRQARIRTLSNPGWVIVVHGPTEDWWIVWNWWDEVDGDEHVPRVFYIGPAPGERPTTG